MDVFSSGDLAFAGALSEDFTVGVVVITSSTGVFQRAIYPPDQECIPVGLSVDPVTDTIYMAIPVDTRRQLVFVNSIDLSIPALTLVTYLN